MNTIQSDRDKSIWKKHSLLIGIFLLPFLSYFYYYSVYVYFVKSIINILIFQDYGELKI